MVLRPGPPPPPRPEFSKPGSTDLAVAKATEPSAPGPDLQVTGRGGKLPPFSVGPATTLRRPGGALGASHARQPSPPTMPVTRAAPTMLSPFSPLPFYTVKGSWERAPSASMQRQQASEQPRRLMHSAPLPREGGEQLLADLAGAVPRRLEGKQWYSELHKMRTKFDPRWHAGPRQDPKLRGNWTAVNISDPVHPTADMPIIPAASSSQHATSATGAGPARRTSARANASGVSNWDGAQLQAVLRERAAAQAHQGASEQAAAPARPEKIDPTLQALLVMDQEPSLKYRGYKRTEGRLQSRLITADYMREFYRTQNKTGARKARQARQELGMLDSEETGGDELQQQWAQARIETLFQRAEAQWDEKYGEEMQERAAHWQYADQRQFASPDAMSSVPDSPGPDDRAHSQRTLMQMMSRHDSTGGVQATPADLRKVRDMMYNSVNSGARDLSAPEYLYYEDPSFGAFDTLVGEDSVTFTRFSDPVQEETARSRLDRVMLRNRAQTMSSGAAAAEVSEFVATHTGLPEKHTQLLVAERIRERVMPRMDGNHVERHAGKAVELGGDLPAHSSHLSKGRTYMRRVQDFDDIFPITSQN